MGTKEMKYPEMRSEWRNAIDVIAQQHTAGSWHMVAPMWGTLDDVVHFLFDDSGLDRGAGALVGDFILDDTEAVEADALLAILKEILDDAASPGGVTAHHRFPQARVMAQALLKRM